MISIILPTYNEAENIGKVIKEIEKNLKKKKHEIIVVDDNSPDGTARIAVTLGKSFPVKVIERKGKRGLSSAVIAGFSITKGKIIGVMDCDLSHPAGIIPKMVEAIEKEGCDLAIGSRHVIGGEVKGWSPQRKIISKLATKLARPLTQVKDPMSGFFFLKNEVIKGAKLNPIGYKILLEIVVKGRYKKIKEIPYTFRDRKAGKSKIGAKVYLDYLKHLLRLYVFILKKRN